MLNSGLLRRIIYSSNAAAPYRLCKQRAAAGGGASPAAARAAEGTDPAAGAAAAAAAPPPPSAPSLPPPLLYPLSLRGWMCLSAQGTNGSTPLRSIFASAAASSSAAAVGVLHPGDGDGEATSCESERVEVVVVGAGVVGLAVARRLAMAGKEVVVVEAERGSGMGTSSRNSEVIHAGLYYTPGSLKARLCVEGRGALYRYCSERDVPHHQLGKLVVATSAEQVPALQALMLRGTDNGVEGLRMLDAMEAMAMEPNLRCVKALHSESTGIVDSHSLMEALQVDAETHGATFAFNSPALSIRKSPSNAHRLIVTTAEGPISPTAFASQPKATVAADMADVPVQPGAGHVSNSQAGGADLLTPVMTLEAELVVNAAGISAIPLAHHTEGLPRGAIPTRHLARGHYFSLAGGMKSPFSRLVYPMPEDGGIGIHLTLDMAGMARFGPDVEWLPGQPADALFEELDYHVRAERAHRFYGEIRKYFPELPDGALQADYSGIRPKISGPGQPPADFVIRREAQHGLPGLVNLFGIESPGLTSCLAIAEVVASFVSAK